MPQVSTSTAILSKEPFKLYLRIEGDLPKSANATLGRNPWIARENSKKWKMIVGNAVERCLPPDLLEYASISITRHSSRLLDYDNFATSIKPIVDGLKDLVIVDDSWKRTGAWRLHQEFRPKNLGSLIELWVTEREEPLEIQ